MIVQAHALWITQASSTTIQALLSLRECSSNISSKFPPKQTLLPIWATAVITTWLHIFFYKTFVGYTPLPPLKKVMPQAQGATDISKEIARVLSARSYGLHRLDSLHYIELFHPRLWSCLPHVSHYLSHEYYNHAKGSQNVKLYSLYYVRYIC